MSSHRVTDKPRLFNAPNAPAPSAPNPPPIEDAAHKPSHPYPNASARHPNRARRHWISIFSMLLAVAGTAVAQTSEEGLAFRTPTGWQPTLALDTAVDMQIHGLIAQVKVRQQFVNDTAEWQEGRYLLPLPSDAAVGSLRVSIGSRLIEGEVREKEAAKQIFAQAAQSGQTAAIVEQARPNLFRTGLTNIGPGERIEVEIGYWQQVSYRDEAFSISLPLTLKPRYVSSALNLANDEQPDSIGSAVKGVNDGVEPTVSVNVDLDAGVPLAGIDSTTHTVTVTQKVGFQRIQLANLVELADRDFELRWRPMPSSVPQRAVFTEEVDGEHYALLMLLPPTLPVKALPREMILVIDTSGSMSGSAMNQAIAALDTALVKLGPQDRFNIIRFSNVSERMSPESLSVTDDSISRARRYVASLSAEGGTEMAPALHLAFEGVPPAGMVRQVVLATDAAIGNEADLLTLIETLHGEARVFPIGIGSAPNSHFIRKAAEIGRGSQVVIRDIQEVAERMSGLFARLDRPVLRDLTVQWPDATDVYPPQLPDLYAGEPLLIVARLPVLQGEMNIVGQTSDRPWRSKMLLNPLQVVRAEGVGRLWGRARIEAIEDAMRLGLGEEEGRALILETALQHGLASRFSSLIAVERTPSRPLDAALAATDIPNAAAADSLALAQGATSARSQIGIAVTLLLIAGAVFRRRDEQAHAPGLA